MKASLEVKELRRRIKNVASQIRWHKNRKPAPNPVFEAARIGFLPSALDIRENNVSLLSVSGKPISFKRLTAIYPCSRQRLHQCAKRYGREILGYPNELHEALRKESSNKRNLLSALSDPAKRLEIAAKLKALANP